MSVGVQCGRTVCCAVSGIQTITKANGGIATKREITIADEDDVSVWC